MHKLSSRAITAVLGSMILLVCAVIVATIWMARNDHEMGPRNAAEAIEIALDFAVAQIGIKDIETARTAYDIEASQRMDGDWEVFFYLKSNIENDPYMEDYFGVFIITKYGLAYPIESVR